MKCIINVLLQIDERRGEDRKFPFAVLASDATNNVCRRFHNRLPRREVVRIYLYYSKETFWNELCELMIFS